MGGMRVFASIIFLFTLLRPLSCFESAKAYYAQMTRDLEFSKFHEAGTAYFYGYEELEFEDAVSHCMLAERGWIINPETYQELLQVVYFFQEKPAIESPDQEGLVWKVWTNGAVGLDKKWYWHYDPKVKKAIGDINWCMGFPEESADFHQCLAFTKWKNGTVCFRHYSCLAKLDYICEKFIYYTTKVYHKFIERHHISDDLI